MNVALHEPRQSPLCSAVRTVAFPLSAEGTFPDWQTTFSSLHGQNKKTNHTQEEISPFGNRECKLAFNALTGISNRWILIDFSLCPQLIFSLEFGLQCCPKSSPSAERFRGSFSYVCCAVSTQNKCGASHSFPFDNSQVQLLFHTSVFTVCSFRDSEKNGLLFPCSNNAVTQEGKIVSRDVEMPSKIS